MAAEHTPKPSFSPWRKWGIALNVGLVILVVLAIVVMANYLGMKHSKRFHLSARTRHPLSSHTVRFLHGLTNQVKVTIYYDKDESLYSTISDLLKEYQNENHKVSIQAVDYLRDPGAAQKVKADYKLSSGTEKNLIIFDCDGRHERFKIVDGAALAQYTLEQVSNESEREFRRKPVSFAGEKMFTSALIAVTSPEPLKAYFLVGHNEHKLDSGDELSGYVQFASVLMQNYIRVENLSLAQSNGVPMDCNLLIIAGPTTPLLDTELEKIEQYLNQGGRLLVLLNTVALERPSGLERILAKWGVEVGTRVIVDQEHSPSGTGSDLVVSAFSKHAVVNPLLGSGLYLVRPRSVGKLTVNSPPADAPRVEEIAFTGTNAVLLGTTAAARQRFPVAVAVEKGTVKNVITERGSTRLVVVGDSFFLGNHQIDLLANRDFAGYLANWLLDRTQLLEGVGARPVNEYRFVMTPRQLQSAELILLGAMPGGVLLLGTLVWLRRRR